MTGRVAEPHDDALASGTPADRSPWRNREAVEREQLTFRKVAAAVCRPRTDRRGNRRSHLGRAHLVLERVGVARSEVLVIADAERDVDAQSAERREDAVGSGLYRIEDAA